MDIKVFRLISTVKIATEILGQEEAKSWLCNKVASLGEQIPMDLLDTKAGHKLVEQALLQIKYGVYN
jgi:putative toxin-antitoxin system antitoxin component (TIGR02293 family)